MLVTSENHVPKSLILTNLLLNKLLGLVMITCHIDHVDNLV